MVEPMSDDRLEQYRKREDVQALCREIDRLRFLLAAAHEQVTRCQEENTREVERRREAEHKLAVACRCLEVDKQQIGDMAHDLAILQEKRKRMIRERDELKGAMKADDERLRAAEEKVWPGRTWEEKR